MASVQRVFGLPGSQGVSAKTTTLGDVKHKRVVEDTAKPKRSQSSLVLLPFFSDFLQHLQSLPPLLKCIIQGSLLFSANPQRRTHSPKWREVWQELRVEAHSKLGKVLLSVFSNAKFEKQIGLARHLRLQILDFLLKLFVFPVGALRERTVA